MWDLLPELAKWGGIGVSLVLTVIVYKVIKMAFTLFDKHDAKNDLVRQELVRVISSNTGAMEKLDSSIKNNTELVKKSCETQESVKELLIVEKARRTNGENAS